MHEELKRLADFFKDAALSEECKIKNLFQQINSSIVLSHVNIYPLSNSNIILNLNNSELTILLKNMPYL